MKWTVKRQFSSGVLCWLSNTYQQVIPQEPNGRQALATIGFRGACAEAILDRWSTAQWLNVPPELLMLAIVLPADADRATARANERSQT